MQGTETRGITERVMDGMLVYSGRPGMSSATADEWVPSPTVLSRSASIDDT